MTEIIREDTRNLPSDLLIPKFHGSYGSKDFDDSSILLLNPSTKGWLTVYLENGTKFRVEKVEDILLLFPSKYNWVYSRSNEIDCITKPLNRTQREELLLLNKTFFMFNGSKYTLNWIPGTAKITLTRDGSTHSTRYLINSAKFTSKSIDLKDFNEIRDLIQKLKILDKDIPVNLMSVAGTARGYLLGKTDREFRIVNDLSIDDLSFIYSAYKGPRMETRYLGTLEDRDNIDMRKAYLNALAKVPAFYRNIVKIERGKKEVFDNAHPGSTYLVKVEVPEVYDRFTPVSLRRDSRNIYPHGEFITNLSKTVLDLLIERQDIPFEIIDSIQFLMLDETNLPFKKVLKDLERYEDENKDRLYPIGLKSLHATMVGSFLSYHMEIDGNTGEISKKSSNTFHPSLAIAMQDFVATDIWRLAHDNNSDAIRVDALTGKNLTSKNGFKRGTSGLMTFLTANLKDKPGSTMYRDYITSGRDKPYVEFHYPRRISFSGGYLGNTTGLIVSSSPRIYPTAGNRSMDPLKYVGELLEGPIETKIPNLYNPFEEEDPRCRVNEFSLDQYLHLFHQIQI